MNDVFSRSRRAALAVLVAFTAVALTGPSLAEAAPLAKPTPGATHGNAKAGTSKGIVQSVSAKAIVLRELDGSTVRVPIAASTRVFVDGKRSSLRNVRAGYVASVTWKAGKPAKVLQAFNLSGKHAVKVGVVDSLSNGVLVVTLSGGGTFSIPVTAKTRVLVDGKPATLAAVKAGYTVVITAQDSKGNKPAHELRFLRPG